MIFKGLLAFFLYLFYLGSTVSLFFFLKKSKNFLFTFFVSSIIFSLFLAWLLFSLNFFLKIDINIYFFYIIISFLNFFLLKQKNYIPNYKIEARYIFFFFIFLTIFFNFIRTPDYDITFAYGDAVVSWNRWAIELYQDRFVDNIGFYPIFWPSLWSMIYSAQGDESFWIFSKATLLIIPFLYFFICFKFLIEKKFLEFAFFIFVFFEIFFQWPFRVYLFSGYMDNPVALLSLVLLMLIINLNFEKKINQNINVLLIFSCLAGIISITKFSGIFTLLFFWLYLIYLFNNRIFNKNFLTLNILISLVPLLIYCSIYFIVLDFSLFNYNIYLLLSISEEKAFSNILVTSFFRILQNLNPFLLILMIGLSILNFFNKNLISNIGKISLITFVIGILLYSPFSYDPRNSFYLVIFLILSSYCSIKNFKFNKYNLRFKNFKKYFITIMLFIILVFSFFVDRYLENTLLNLDKDKIKRFPIETKKQIKDFKDLYNLIK